MVADQQACPIVSLGSLRQTARDSTEGTARVKFIGFRQDYSNRV
jgi:hypothetical protein